jgi:hypothetical protein
MGIFLFGDLGHIAWRARHLVQSSVNDGDEAIQAGQHGMALTDCSYHHWRSRSINAAGTWGKL